MRKRVSLLVATGMGERGIALAVKCDRKTLCKYFEDELRDGRDLYRAELLDMLQTAACAGNVSAMKHLDKRTSGETANPGGFAGGKKAEQLRAAEHAVSNSEWGDDLALIAVPPRTN
jgi:hypothetical protein